MKQEIKKTIQAPHADFVSRLLYLPRGISRLVELGERKIFPKNYELVRAGAIPKYCYIVKSGRVAAYEYTIGGEERIYNFNECNSLLLEANVLFDYVSPVNFKTTLPSELICIDKETLLEAISRDPQVSMDVMESLATKFMSSMDQIRHANFHNAEWKICDLLLIFADRYGVPYDGKILIKEKVSQQLLSNLLGINRVTAVRAIKSLKEMSLIEQINGYYCIRDVERLKRHQERLLL
ncbi:MAG: Crp/Fnr family transcriptional regulator [Lachnospiraceae bacterium]|nr:Crp/Fnr family transcriptional regulator [Lachnospiraceae bacterium]